MSVNKNVTVPDGRTTNGDSAPPQARPTNLANADAPAVFGI
jgi:hypothetical protein